MSMYRQLWLALIVSTLLALTGSLLAWTYSTQAYMQKQLRNENADNAAVLALSMSQKDVDPVQLELMVAAVFDSGHYDSISIVDPAGKTIVQRRAQSIQSLVPAWFVRLLPIASPQGQAQITNGWKQVGTVFLVSSNRAAEQALWESTLKMLSALALAGFVGGYLGTLILRRLKQPLDAVIDQARAITEHRFITTPEPKVPELRQLAAAMNSTVTILKTMFANEAERLESVRREANCDPLTGLANRSYFMAQLRAKVASEDVSDGSLILMRVAHLADINRRLGRDATDTLLQSVGKVVGACAERFPGGLAARLNGADFALILPHREHRPVADELLALLVSATSGFLEGTAVAFIGCGTLQFGQDVGTLLTQVDAALASAEAAGINGVREAATLDIGEGPRSAEEWGKLIGRALEQRWVRLASFPVVQFSGNIMHRESALRLMFGGEWFPAGRFLPIAERLGLTVTLDLAAITTGLTELVRNPGLSGIAINLSARSIQDDAFRAQLRSLIGARPGVSQRLWLEIPEMGAFANVDAFRSFCREMRALDCHVGIEHFGRQFSQIGLLHELEVNYIKIDASFIRDIDTNSGNQIFLRGLTSITHAIGVKVIAEGVQSAQELQMLATLDFDGATGPAVRDTETTNDLSLSNATEYS